MELQDQGWRTQMRIRVDVNNMMAERLGARGIPIESLEAMSPRLQAACEAMRQKRPSMKWRELPYMDEAILAQIEQVAKDVANRCENFVVLGIGGSALGPIAVQRALSHLHYNSMPREKRGGPRLFVEDNVDPERMAALLDVIDVRKSVFNVITKSGSTSETMAQLLIIMDLLKKELGEEALSKHIIATTDVEKGNLIKIAKQLQLQTFFVPDGVGGRFSELCPVGLLPAAVCGIDIRALLQGAADMDKRCETENIWQNPAYLLAALQVLAMERGMNISVMMPYADSLSYMADWYAQLWAESLGKRYSLAGEVVHTGQTPVKALGVTDQHSQVQLYTEGPYDKVITFLTVGEYRQQVQIPDGFSDIPDVAFLCGHSLNELIQAEQAATEYALFKSGHLSHTITLPAVNAYTIGQLLYMLEVQTAYTGELLGIDAFDQPGVEEGKNATYALLGKPGYSSKKTELDARPAQLEAYELK